MNKREFLKTGILGLGAALVSRSLLASSNMQDNSVFATLKGTLFEQPPLGYTYDALEPYIDARTMEIHYTKHHAAYTKNLNDQLAKLDSKPKSLIEIFENISSYPAGIRNNGGGYFNHNLFWKVIAPGGSKSPSGILLEAINRDFGSFENFKTAFTDRAMGVFGSGWAWLIKTQSGLKITSTANQDNPLMGIAADRGIPILLVDVWEHAYYLKYQNRRKEYLEAFWQVVNWDQVQAFYQLDRVA
jgi:Fe-Mn family superoxide dismutase